MHSMIFLAVYMYKKYTSCIKVYAFWVSVYDVYMYTKLTTCTAHVSLWAVITNTYTCDYTCILMFLKGHAFHSMRKYV